MIDKARRLARDGAVKDLGGGRFEVRGDTATHKLAFSWDPSYPDTYCSCRASAFGAGCSHRLAVEIFLSQSRRAS